MEAGEYIRILAEFITGEIDILKFKQLIEDRLFELRENLETTDEKGVLSETELLLHEVEEGLRDEREVYTQVQSLLDKILLERMRPAYLSPTSTKLLYSLSKTFPPDKRPITRDLSLATSK